MNLPSVRVPVDLGRDEAAAAARRELSRGVYQADDEPLPVRVGRWLLEQIRVLVDRAGDLSPGGRLGLLIVILVLVGVAALARARLGPLGGPARRSALVTGAARDASAYRAAAQQAAQQGDWAVAIREQLRAVAREVTEQGVVDDRPGRTADELAAEVARALPTVRTGLLAATTVFDRVWYGGQPADAATYQVVAAADEQVRRAARSPRAQAGPR